MKIKLKYLSSIYIIFVIVGFLFISSLPTVFGLKEDSFSLQYRILVLIFALSIITIGIKYKYIFKNFINNSWFLIFWLIYSFRIIYDLFFSDIILYQGKTNSFYFQQAFFVTFIPTFALLFIDFQKINFTLVLKWCYRILCGTLILAIFLRLGGDYSGRTTGSLEVGILLYGQFGTSLSLLSLFFLLKSNSAIKFLVYLFGFILGLLTILLSASRSPFIALAIVSIIYIILIKKNYKIILLSSLLIILFFTFFLDLIELVNNFFPNDFLFRMFNLFNGDESASIRLHLYKQAFTDFIDNPIFGSAMLIQSDWAKGSYPHNLILEAFMATGILGGLFFVLFLLKVFYRLKVIFYNNTNLRWIPLLFLQFFIFGMFSGNLYSSYMFWFLAVIIINSSKVKSNNLKE